jgi:uncharacterized protein
VVAGDARHALNEKLAAFDRQTSTQDRDLVDRHLPEGTTLEKLAGAAYQEWEIGRKGKDNGALLILFTDDRKMRIEVGYGLEGSLTDGCGRATTPAPSTPPPTT